MKEMTQPRILVIQDISASCRISMNVALPVLSVLNNEVNMLPTALLSTHTTSGFENYTYLDLADESDKILKHWKELGLTFDGVLVGYLGSIEQINRVQTVVDAFLKPDGLFILDPVMADQGKLYDGFDQAYIDSIRGLCREAEIIIPNLTEAAFLTYTQFEDIEAVNVREVIKRVADMNQSHVIITGVTKAHASLMGAASYNYESGVYEERFAQTMPGHFEGTGDLFSSVVAGLMLQGKSIHEVMEIAVVYVNKVIKRTAESGKEVRYGVQFETDLPYLIEQLNRYE